MQIYEKNESMLYKGSCGARIMIRISLPMLGENTDLDILYGRLFDSYISAAKRFVDSPFLQGEVTYYFTVRYECERDENKVKIKRFSSLKKGKTPIREAVATDLFKKNGVKLKK